MKPYLIIEGIESVLCCNAVFSNANLVGMTQMFVRGYAWCRCDSIATTIPHRLNHYPPFFVSVFIVLHKSSWLLWECEKEKCHSNITSLVSQYITEFVMPHCALPRRVIPLPHPCCWCLFASSCTVIFATWLFASQKKRKKRERRSKKKQCLSPRNVFRNCAKRKYIYKFIWLMFQGFICYKYRHRHFLHTLHVSIVITKHNKRANVWLSLAWREKNEKKN